MSLLSALDRVIEHNPEPFIAPVPHASSVNVFTVQNDIPYNFRLRGNLNLRSGWWTIVPRSKADAVIGDPVLPYQKLQFLDQLPRFYVIAVSPINRDTWLCVPYNLSDAKQRGWPNGQPKNIYLTYGNIQPFDVLIARKLDQVLLFETVNTRITSFTRECQENHMDSTYNPVIPNALGFAMVLNIVRGILEEQRLLQETEERKQARARHLEQIKQQQLSVEEQARFQLEFMGAQLLDISANHRGYTVTWRVDGAEFTQDVNTNLQVESAGICLNDTDSKYNLSAIVNVMQTARELRRFDLDENLWI